MISIYKVNENKILEQIKEYQKDSWVNLVEPSSEEINTVVANTGIDLELVNKVLDHNEIARIEEGEKSIMVIIDYPYVEDHKRKTKYQTFPLGIVISKDYNYIVTITAKPSNILDGFFDNTIKNIQSSKQVRLVIQIILCITKQFQKSLKVINDEIENQEKTLIKSTKNKDLISLLNIQKSLVYFTTSLKENGSILEKLAKKTQLPLYDEDIALLETAIIENKQCVETSNIYREIVTSTSEIYATVISNNLNIIMKFLAGITIIFSIPTMIASFFGMNVKLGDIGTYPYAFIIIFGVSIVVSVILAIYLKKKDML